MRNWLTALKRFGCMAVPLVAISLNDISAHLADGELSLEEREVALRVKGRETSQLIVDKYYRRFVEVIRNRRQRTPTANESREWLALFKAKQVMIAHAEALGYFRRPEINAAVVRMEQHMLTQASGPFYNRLLTNASLLSHDNIETFSSIMARQIEGVIVRVGRRDVIGGPFGAGFEALTVDQQTRRIVAYAQEEGLQIMTGKLSWPFAPLFEVAHFIGQQPSGHWIEHNDPTFGLYYVLITRVDMNPSRNKAPYSGGLDALEQRVRPLAFQRRRHCAWVASSGFNLVRPTADRLTSYCQNLPVDAGMIPPVRDEQFSTEELFSYRMEGELATVSVDDFRRHFNGMYVRDMPRSLADLRQAAEAMAIEAMDLREAYKLGIDQTPRFEEERRGFEAFQVLDLLEKEMIVPGISIDQSDIERYYRDHAAEFHGVTRIRGRLLRFASIEEAVAWLNGESMEASRDEAREATVDKPIPGLEPAHMLLFQCAEGTKIGPISDGESTLVFIKQKNMAFGALPLATVRDAIRKSLMRKAIDNDIVRRAAEMAAHLTIEDHIDYARYGLPATTFGSAVR